MTTERVELTSADIARLANVRPSAVSNWRRRHADFPAPVGGSDKNPTFDLTEIMDWLRQQGRSVEIPLVERLWRGLDALRDTVPPGDNLGIVGLFLLHLHHHPTQVPGDREEFIRALTRAEHAMLFRNDRVVAGLSSLLTPVELSDGQLVLLHLAAQAAEVDKPAVVFDHLCSRFLDSGAPTGFSATPPELARLMLDLAAPARGTLLDPACGSAEILLAAVGQGYQQLHGQEINPVIARIAALRLTFATPSPADPRFDIHDGDSLRDDAYAARAAQAVICNPPFAERSWGHEDLELDSRWEYGIPSRLESELAWVQHCLAHVAPGAPIVILMPPAAAGRPSGRRIRAALTSSGALRAVISLPPRMAAQYSVALQLWILHRPSGRPSPGSVLFVDASGHVPTAGADHGEAPTWTSVRELVTQAWTAFRDQPDTFTDGTVSRAVPIADIVDDEVDLTPRRYLPLPATAAASREELAALRKQTGDLVAQLDNALPAIPPKIQSASGPVRVVSLQDLTQSGAVFIRRAHQRDLETSGISTTRAAVVRAIDIVNGGPPGEIAEVTEDPLRTIQAGDVLVPLIARRLTARVATDDYVGAYLSPSVFLIRANPSLLDPWFLAGYLSSSGGAHQASRASNTLNDHIRFDPRRVRIPLLPLQTQQAYGEMFRSLDQFERLLHATQAAGQQLVHRLTDVAAADLPDTTVGLRIDDDARLALANRKATLAATPI